MSDRDSSRDRPRPAFALALACLGAATLVVGCGSDSEPATESSTTEASAEEEGGGSGGGGAEKKPASAGDEGGSGGGKGVTISTGESQFGEILFDGDQGAIYLFDKETSETSECYDACAEAWPPVLTKGEPQASGDVKADLLGTTERDDGKTQVTYDGQPLYYYVDDGPGQVLCHDVEEFGGLWLVLDANGDAIS